MSGEKTISGKEQEMKEGTIEDVKEGVGILERIANVFKTIFELFKSKEK